MGRSAEVRVGLQAGGCSLDSARPQRTTRFRSTPTRWPLPGLSRRRYHGFPNVTSRRPEFTFRFNRRRSRRRGLLFYRLLEQAILAEPITYRSLIANPSPTGRRPAHATQPGRVATVAAVHRPWRQSPANTRLPESNR